MQKIPSPTHPEITHHFTLIFDTTHGVKKSREDEQTSTQHTRSPSLPNSMTALKMIDTLTTTVANMVLKVGGDDAPNATKLGVPKKSARAQQHPPALVRALNERAIWERARLQVARAARRHQRRQQVRRLRRQHHLVQVHPLRAAHRQHHPCACHHVRDFLLLWNARRAADG